VKLFLQHVFCKIEYHIEKLAKHLMSCGKGFQPNLKYLRVWGCLAKVMLPDPKKRKIGSKTSDCLVLGYAEHSAAYRFLILNSDIIERNTIVETKNVEFFEHIFPLKLTSTSDQPIEIAYDPMSEDLRRSPLICINCLE